MRTPVRPGSGARPDARLWASVAKGLAARQLWVELYGLPGYGLTLGGATAEGFAVSPRDFRPLPEEAPRPLLSGKLTLAGLSLDADSPLALWNSPTPSRAFAVELHSFAWMPAMMATGDRGAREALAMVLAWHEVFSRWSPFSWDPDILARRVYRLACAGRRLASVATEIERLRLTDILARQARQLLRPPGGTMGRAERLTAAAVAGCALSGKTGATIRSRALKRLPGALAATVAPDGAHASRAPEMGLELLLDLLTLDDALAQLSEVTPEPVAEAISRLTLALRVQTLPDRRLAVFQGGGPSTPERVAAARAHDDAPAAPPSGAVGGLLRVSSPLLTVMVDVEAPARNAWSAAACGQPAALEVVCGRDRLFTSAGWTPRAPDRQALRLTPGASTLTLGEQPLGEPLSGWKGDLLGPRLIAPPIHVTRQHQEGDGAVWLEVEHDGWMPLYGLMHQRRLYIDQRLDELRAEERLHPPADRPEVVRALAAPYALRFQLEPGVQASLARDRRSILLRGHSGRGWWFRSDGPDVAIEPAVHIDDGLTRRSLQIVVRGSARTDAETKVRWKLSPAGASGEQG
ncbi:Heparinase II/III-like protein [compost metagenome]